MKKTMFALSTISLAVSLSLLSSHALAYSSASASITDLTYTLADLDPYDGITPSLEMYIHSTVPNFSNVSGSANDKSTGGTASFYNTGDQYSSNLVNKFSPVSGSASSGSTYATATVGTNSFSAQGYALGHNNDKYSSFDATANPTANITYITLSPQTSLTFTGTALQTAATSYDDFYADSGLTFEGYSLHDVYTSPRFGGTSNISSYYGFQTIQKYNESGEFEEYSFSEPGMLSYAFSHTLTNNSDSNFYGIISIGLAVRGESYSANTSPIPEPSTYAMLLAGLCLITFASRRNKNA